MSSFFKKIKIRMKKNFLQLDNLHRVRTSGTYLFPEMHRRGIGYEALKIFESDRKNQLRQLQVVTKYIFYCKRAILFLSSSKILTPHPPLRPASLSSPRNKAGGYTTLHYTLAGRRGGWGVNILEDDSKICTLPVLLLSEVPALQKKCGNVGFYDAHPICNKFRPFFLGALFPFIMMYL